MIKYLKLSKVVKMHDLLIEQFGGLSGIRDWNLLSSAVEHPKAAMFGQDVYPRVYDKAAAYLFHIVKNHPFNDGNKRTGAAAAYSFLVVNKVSLVFDNDDDAFEQLVVEVAAGGVIKEEIAYFFEHGARRQKTMVFSLQPMSDANIID